MPANENMSAPSRVAVLLHGDFAAGRKTAATLARHVLDPLGACLFRFGSAEGQPIGLTGSAGSADDDGQARLGDGLANIPGATVSRTMSREAFLEDAQAIGACLQRVPGIDPARLLATFHDMAGAIALLRDYERRSGTTFDTIILLRSDLALYAPISARPDRGTVHIPAGRGLDNETGAPLMVQRTVHPFVSADTGDLIPDTIDLSFQHQIIALHRDDLFRLDNLYDQALELLRRGVPASHETVLHLLLVTRAGMKSIRHREWLYGQRHDGQPLLERTTAPQMALSKIGLRDQKPEKRVAVLLSGLLRDYQTTAGSLLRHVVVPNDASLFYFGPAQSDRPQRSNMGVYDEHGFFISNPKGDFQALDAVDTTEIFATYGRALKRVQFHDVSQETFRSLASKVYPREDWLFMLSPHRLLSMFYNMTGAVNLLRQYEDEVGFAFDEVIITRPDLAFYTPISPTMSPGEVHVAGGEGFDANGIAHQGSASAYFYKNAMTGDYVSGGRVHSFNDQILALTRDDLHHFYNLYEQLIAGFRQRVPASPETIFHLLLAERAGLSVISHPEWRHEIFRGDDSAMQNVTDIPEIVHIDPRNPKAARRLSVEQAREAVPPLPETRTPSFPEPSLVRTSPSTALLQELALDGSGQGAWSRFRARQLLRRARSRRRGGDLVSAERLYARVLQLAPSNRREWVQYGHVLKDQGHAAAALTAYEMALALDSTDADALLHREAVRNSL
jgi:tetratricopeptide (TPR) repeat protein